MLFFFFSFLSAAQKRKTHPGEDVNPTFRLEILTQESRGTCEAALFTNYEQKLVQEREKKIRGRGRIKKRQGKLKGEKPNKSVLGFTKLKPEY